MLLSSARACHKPVVRCAWNFHLGSASNCLENLACGPVLATKSKSIPRLLAAVRVRCNIDIIQRAMWPSTHNRKLSSHPASASTPRGEYRRLRTGTSPTAACMEYLRRTWCQNCMLLLWCVRLIYRTAVVAPPNSRRRSKQLAADAPLPRNSPPCLYVRVAWALALTRLLAGVRACRWQKKFIDAKIM